MGRPVYCFIDDSPFELKLFRDVIDIRYTDINFLYAGTYAECHSKIQKQGWYPSLFILDLYGREGRKADVKIPEKDLLTAQIVKIPDLSVAYKGLDTYKSDKNLQANEFLKRLFSIVHEWRNIFSEQCANLDQGSRYGISNLQCVRQDYPDVTAVMYTRKGIFPDALKLSRLNCDGIFIKPAGATDEDIYSETQKQADNLMDDWNECVRNRYCLFLQKLTPANQKTLELAGILSQGNHHTSTDKEIKYRVSTLINSLPASRSGTREISMPEVNALIQWIRFYYGIS